MQQRAKLRTAVVILLLAVALIVAVAVGLAFAKRSSALSLNTGLDSVAPEITVDLKGYNSYGLPEGKTGVKYPVFTAAAYDAVDGECEVYTRVYRKGTNRNLYDAGTQTFLPSEAGVYVMEYSAEDRAGNSTVRRMGIAVSDDLSDPAVEGTFDDATHTTGLPYTLPVAQTAGGSGTSAESIAITLNNQTVFEADSFGAYTFTPEQSGVYTVVYKVCDFLNRESERSFTLTAEESDEPIVSEIFMPDSVTAGIAFDLPDYEAVDYSGDGLPKDTKKSVTIEYQGQTTTLEPGASYTPALTGAAGTTAELKITFKAEGANGTFSDTRNVTVVQTKTEEGTFYLPSYMQPYSGSAIAVEDDAAMKFSSTQEGASMRYIKDMLAMGFTVRMVPQGADSFTVRVFDSVDPGIAFEITLTAGAESTAIAINGEEVGSESTLFGGTFILGYSASGITVNLQTFAAPALDMSGDAFAGFPSGKVRFSVTFGAPSGTEPATVSITGVGSQVFTASQTMSDAIGPEIYIEEPAIVPRLQKGESFTIPAGYAADILSDVASFTVTVTANGNTVFESDDPVAGAAVTTDQFGYYRITYTAVDTSGKTSQRVTTVYVVDTEAPVITVSGTLPASVSVGDTVAVPDFSASDNYTSGSSLETRIIVIGPDYDHRVIAPDENGEYSFTADREGKYTVRYYAEDEDGNYVFEDHVIYAEA